MIHVISRVRHLLVSEDGPTAVEYAVMLALIVVACSLIVGYPAAYVLARMNPRWATLIIAAIVASALIALLNALLPPIVAALRLPYTLIAGFLLVALLLTQRVTRPAT